MKGRHHFRQLRRNDDDRHAARGHCAEQLVNLRFGSDVDAPSRLVDDQDLGVQCHAARKQNLLLVAARERSDRRLGAGHLDVEG